MDGADRLGFNGLNGENFYGWGWQVSLWLSTATQSDGGLVVNSAPFFDLDLSTKTLSSDSQLAMRAERTDSTEEATQNAFAWGDDNLVYFGVPASDG